MEELSKEELICMMEDYKDKYELAIEERDEEILRTLNQHDDMLDLQDKIDQREMFTKAAMKQLKEVIKERDNLKHQLGKLTEKNKSSKDVGVKRVEPFASEDIRVNRVEAVVSENVQENRVESVASEEYNEEAEALLQRSEQLLESQHQLQQIRQQLDTLEGKNSKYQTISPITSSSNESVEHELQQIRQQLDMLDEINLKNQIIQPIESLSNESVEVQTPLSAIFSSSFDNTPLPTLRKRSSQISPPPARYGRPKSFVEPVKVSNPAPDGIVSFDDTPLPTLCQHKPPVSPPLPALQRRKSLFKPNKDAGQAKPVQNCMNPFKVLPPVAEKPSSTTAAAFFVSFDDTPLPKVPMPPVSPPPARLSRPKSYFVPEDGPVEPVQNCVNTFKALSPIAGKPPLLPVVRRQSSVQVSKPVIRRRSSVRAMSPVIRRRSSVRAMPPVYSSAVRSTESNGHFVLPAIGEQSHF